VTGSAWVVDAAHARVLLTHHRKLDMWLQLGGHADGDTDVLRVAMREAAEESGLTELIAVDAGVFDVDVHRIPPRGGEPAHLHYDVRFLLQGDASVPLVMTAESRDLRWVRLADVVSLGVDASVLRMVAKTQARAATLRCGPETR
jgi:8-oxo-dGTP pyrophosphatase MutT (NUDIX family)